MLSHTSGIHWVWPMAPAQEPIMSGACAQPRSTMTSALSNLASQEERRRGSPQASAASAGMIGRMYFGLTMTSPNDDSMPHSPSKVKRSTPQSFYKRWKGLAYSSPHSS